MTIVTRLRLLAGLLGTAAATAVIGHTVFGDIRGGSSAKPAAVPTAARSDAERVADEFAKSKFATQPTLVFRGPDGPAIFAWQVKPASLPSTIRDRDILAMVDTSASQAGDPLKKARQILTALASTAAPGDRIDVWTVNLDNPQGTRSLTRGFKPANSADVQSAVASLTDTEFAAGATDLKAGLEKALAAFEKNPARQQVLLFLGDGESAASRTPLDEAARVDLGNRMEQNEIAFFAVPLGVKVNPHNLHGFAALTGGTVVRLSDDVTTERGRSLFGAKLKTAFDVPVLKPGKVTYGPAIASTFPTRLPPLRTDKPMLVIGTLKEDAPSLTARVEGTVAGRPVTIELAESLAVADNANYFLHPMLEQWKSAAVKDEPAILAADRALALASQQFQLFREEYLAQAIHAVMASRVDHAEKLFQAALKIDPTNADATTGIKVLERVRKGELPLAKLTAGGASKARSNITAMAETQDPPAAAPKGANVSPADALRQAQAERAVQEQQFRVLVDETIRRARALLATDPDGAYEDLKRQRDVVLANTQLSESYRQRLVADLEASMQTISTKGAEIKRRAAEERERIARTTLRINEFERQRAAEEATKSQIEAFKQLMQQARFELAQQEAQIMIQDRVARGQTVPPEVVGAYMIGQAATNYREYRELVRIREDRYLLTMMQVEKSFIPYPDEPPVHFPPAAVWRELTRERARTAAGTLGGNLTRSQREMQNILDNQRIRIEGNVEMSLNEFLNQIEKNHGLKFVILEEEFKLAGEVNVREKKLALKQSLYGLTVGSALDIALQNVQLTYVVRPEYIEITTYDKRLKEKVVQAFDVGELVYDIPSSVNQAVLFQNQNVQAQNLALFGQAAAAATFLGSGAGGLGIGGLAAAGGAQGGFLAGGAGVLGATGIAQNLGQGGGVAGVGGGQIGQFGNLGGQFGIQGNALANYQLIANLVMEVVARGEWADLGGQFNVTAVPGPNNNVVYEPIPKLLPEDQLNSLAYYPPARAMIVRATGKFHPQSSIKLKKTDGGVQGGPGNPARDQRANAAPAAPAGPGAAGGNDDRRVAADRPAAGGAQLAQIDRRVPAKMWQQAIDLTNVTDPGLIVAAADFLIEYNEFTHAAEVLKCGIRSGLTTDVWAQEALALALKSGQGGGATFDAERASLSGIDLDPSNPKAYMKAAKASDEAGRSDIALAFCQRAAELDPNQPVAYANALVYADKANDINTDAIRWATANLLGRDWIDDGIDYHAEAKSRLNRIVSKFETSGRKEQAEQFRKVLDDDAQRDLVIELLWQGEADLDLYVSEPNGSVAGPTRKRTSGGGVIKGDILEQGNDRSETYIAAQAFDGTYLVSAKQAFKSAVGAKAQVKVTMFKGTDRESVSFHTLNLNENQPIEIHLTGGSRTELATLSEPEPPAPLVTTPGNRPRGGGIGSPTGTKAQATAYVPAIVKPYESKADGIAPAAPGMRAETTLSPDRTQVRISATPVFGAVTDIPLPKVSLLPGGGR